MRLLLLLFSVCISIFPSFGQNLREHIDLNWESASNLAISETNSIEILSFKGADYNEEHPSFPIFHKTIPLNNYSELSVQVTNTIYEPLVLKDPSSAAHLTNQLIIEKGVGLNRAIPEGYVYFVPIRKVGAGFERLVSFDLEIDVQTTPNPYTALSSRNGTYVSALSDGDIYKIAVDETGLYKLDANFLQGLGINISNLDPRKIQLFGNGGGMLPELNSTPRPDDLLENTIQVVGEGDGSFDNGDYILFYGEGPSVWKFIDDAVSTKYERINHEYSTRNYYYLKIGSQNGKRVTNRASVNSTTGNSSTFDVLAIHEEDNVNLFEKFASLPPSGREWYGEAFQFSKNQQFDFKLKNVRSTDPVKVTFTALARTISTSSNFTVKHNGNSIINMQLGSVPGGVYELYAYKKTQTGTLTANSDNITLEVDFLANNSGEGWLDYIKLEGRADLDFSGHNGQLLFTDANSLNNTSTTFSLNNGASTTVWDVTDIENIQNQQGSQSGNTYVFGANTSTLRKFLAFDGSNYLSPINGEKIDNQNLHGIATPPNLLIIYHQEFKTAAQRLADHRQNINGMTVEMAKIEEVYNEFSSGKADFTSIRDFAKLMYERSTSNQFKYLLLIGDGTFDYRSIKFQDNNTNFIPLFETKESLDPVNSFTTDDYFALLDPNEGSVTASGNMMDIAVGRLPVGTEAEANKVVDKILHYERSATNLKDWKNRLTFAADDEDGNLHLNDADDIASSVAANNKIYNLSKTYFDAFPQEVTPAGNRYPLATKALLNSLFKGTFIMNYMGHGGQDGWAQERVFTNSHLNGLDNIDALPLFITATCSFAPHDDPALTSAGELLILNPDGGACALLTTTRLVYASSNKALTSSVFSKVFNRINGEYPTIGEIMRRAKNSATAGTSNTRKFTLLGDPSMRLTYPEYNVVTSEINGNPILSSDTLGVHIMRALDEVTIKGYVENPVSGGPMTDFNGTVYVTIFDKFKIEKTLGNDSDSNIRDYDIQKNIIFKGRVSATNGMFSVNFIVPKDINYSDGAGKLSYYAEDGIGMEANGYFDNFSIGGTNPNAAADNQGPSIELFMNDEQFVFGGLTNDHPTLLVKLFDESGINIVGNSVGHDLTAVLDDDTRNTFILNEFYESDLNNFRRGEVRYPLSELKEGKHQIKVKAWDVHNNSIEDFTEFVVASSADIALSHVLNYPNPFTTNTCFQFEHNYPGQQLDVQIQIFTISGRLVKTINESKQSEGFRIADIKWDGTDDFGDRIGKGVYVYKVNVRADAVDADNPKTASKFEKLVILK